MIVIDGSIGEGGGQILRTALSVSAIYNRTVKITNIRANRPNPGLAAQHLTATEAVADITSASLEGNTLGSTELIFDPSHVPQGDKYELNVDRHHPSGSAGSSLLVLQTVLIPLSYASESSRIRLRGGTHVAWSPSYHYITDVYSPLLDRLGFSSELNLKRWGFYPEGKGVVDVTIQGNGSDFEPSSLELTDRGNVVEIGGFSAVANLDPDILDRQTCTANENLENAGFEPVVKSRFPESTGPGTVVYITAEYENVTASFVSYGKKGKPAETVAEEAVEKFIHYHEKDEPVGRFLADQLILPLSLADSSSVYRTTELTQHLLTNIDVVRQFNIAEIELDGTFTNPASITIHPEK